MPNRYASRTLINMTAQTAYSLDNIWESIMRTKETDKLHQLSCGHDISQAIKKASDFEAIVIWKKGRRLYCWIGHTVNDVTWHYSDYDQKYAIFSTSEKMPETVMQAIAGEKLFQVAGNGFPFSELRARLIIRAWLYGGSFA